MRGQIGLDVVLSTVGIFLAFALVSGFADKAIENVEQTAATILCYTVQPDVEGVYTLLTNAGLTAHRVDKAAGMFTVVADLGSGEVNVLWDRGYVSCG